MFDRPVFPDNYDYTEYKPFLKRRHDNDLVRSGIVKEQKWYTQK